MTLYKNKYRIETTRLKSWDYSSNGYYYITICTKNREHIFGKIAVETGFKPVSTKNPVSTMIMILNEYGKIVEKCWYDLSEHYSNLKLDEFVIMPNHIHGIMIIDNNDVPASVVVSASVETGLKPVSTTTSSTSIPAIPAQMPNKKQHGLFEFVRALKTFSSRQINEFRNSPGTPVWQSRFYDRIVRDENELNRIREYIQNNPIDWKNDDLNMGVAQ